MAEAGKAKALVLAIDDIEASVRTAEIVRQHYPDLPIYARARNRNHVHRLMDLGVEHIHRETFETSLGMTRDLLAGLGLSPRDVSYTVEQFAEHDRRRLTDDYAHFTDVEKIRAKALSDAQTSQICLMKTRASGRRCLQWKSPCLAHAERRVSGERWSNHMCWPCGARSGLQGRYLPRRSFQSPRLGAC